MSENKKTLIRFKNGGYGIKYPDGRIERITEEEAMAIKKRSAARKAAAGKTDNPPKRYTEYSNGVKNGGKAAGKNSAAKKAGKKSSGTAKKGAAKKSGMTFWKGYRIYLLFLAALAVVMMIYTFSSLVRYEHSQSDYVIEKYVKQFKKDVKSGKIEERLDLPEASGVFEPSDIYLQKYIETLGDPKELTYRRNPSDYNTSEPVYDIMKGEDVVAQITLIGKDPKVIFGILEIYKWEEEYVKPVATFEVSNYTICVPDAYKVTVNGVELDDTYKTGNKVSNPDFQYVQEYVDMPALVEYKLEGFMNVPEIAIYDADGNDVAFEPDENGNVYVAYSGGTGDIPEDLYEQSLTMAETWEDFLTADLGGDRHGLATVQQYLIAGSYYDTLAQEYSVSPDITFISPHSCKDPKFTDIVVDNYCKYTDNCYSAHIAFTKNMLLTRTGADSTDVFDSTVYFVYYDDSDDGVDNPHWAMVDMIATKNDTADGE